jgi:TolB-like protein
MSDVFISYARSTTAKQAQAVAEALRGLGYDVWLDTELPAHRSYSDVIEERLKAARAVIVIWSAEAAKSEWVRSEADRAREEHKLVQVRVDGARLPMPFDQIQCADLAGWSGDLDAPGWAKVAGSVRNLVGGSGAGPSPSSQAQPSLPSKPSIAVMPFANLSGDAEQDYFADGMVEEIVAALTRFKSIFVIASGSTLSFKGKAVTPREVARELGVRYVLEGSVRKAGGRVRIAVKLIDAGDGAQIWADRFEDTLEDVFALQDKVALAVAGVIEPSVRLAEIRRVSKRPTENMGSYDLYLRAMALYETFAPAEVFKAIELLERSVALDPDFAPAMSVAAQSHAYIVAFGWTDDPASHRQKGVELAQRALRVRDADSQVLAQAAYSAIMLTGDLEAGAPHIDRAKALNPGASHVWQLSGIMQIRRGNADLGIEQVETAMRLDPVSSVRQTAQRMFIAIGRLEQGRLAEAAAILKETTRQIDTPFGHAILAAVEGLLGNVVEAKSALARYRERSNNAIERSGAFFIRPEHRERFLEGVAIAEGERPVPGTEA